MLSVAMCYLSSRYITVLASKVNVRINDAKDLFEQTHEERPAPEGEVGKHKILAHQRRVLEEVGFSLLIDQSGYKRVRDVGGSRTRWSRLGHKKHICARVNQAADVLREEKGDEFFENCYQTGQACPQRFEIPAAILSHVDYYMTPEEILECVNGPTLVINHRFGLDGQSGTYGKFIEETIGADGKPVKTERHEATWTNRGGQISMDTGDGTPFRHGFNLWQNEGTIVSASKAASYVRLCHYLDSDVYLVTPSAGTYDINDTARLRRAPSSKDVPLYTPSGQFEVEKTVGENGLTYVYKQFGSSPVVCPAEIVESCAARMALTLRDNKYDSALKSLVLSDLKSKGKGLTAICGIVEAHVRRRANEHLHTHLTTRTLRGFDPVNDTLVKYYAYRAWDWVIDMLPIVLVDCLFWMLERPEIRPMLVRFGVHHYVAPYEVFAHTMNARMDGSRMKYRFPSKPQANTAGVDLGAGHRAAKVADKCVSERGEESCQPSAPTAPCSDWASPACHPNQPGDGSPSPTISGIDGVDAGWYDDLRFGDFGPGGSTAGFEVGDAGGRAKEGSGRHEDGDDVSRWTGFGQGGFGDVRPPVHGTVDFEGMYGELLADDGEDAVGLREEYFGVRQGLRGLDFCVQVHTTEFDETVSIPMFDRMSPEKCREAIALLCALPRIPYKRLRCFVRWAVRVVGGTVLSCGLDGHPTDCLYVRVHRIGDGPPLPSHRPVTIRGMGWQIPSGETITTSRGPGRGDEVRWRGCEDGQGKVLPEERVHHEDDRSPEHITPNGPLPVDDRPVHRSPGKSSVPKATPANIAAKRKQEGRPVRSYKSHARRARGSGKGAGSKNKK